LSWYLKENDIPLIGEQDHDNFYNLWFYVKWSSGRCTWEKDGDLGEYANLLNQFKNTQQTKSVITLKKIDQAKLQHQNKIASIDKTKYAKRYDAIKCNHISTIPI
jgi:hypothetical protein